MQSPVKITKSPVQTKNEQKKLITQNQLIKSLLVMKTASEHREVLNKVFKSLFLEENLTPEFKCDIYTTINSLEQFFVKLDAKV